MTRLEPVTPLPCKVCGEKPRIGLEYSCTGIYTEAYITHCCMHKVRLQIKIDCATSPEVVKVWNDLMGVDE